MPEVATYRRYGHSAGALSILTNTIEHQHEHLATADGRKKGVVAEVDARPRPAAHVRRLGGIGAFVEGDRGGDRGASGIEVEAELQHAADQPLGPRQPEFGQTRQEQLVLDDTVLDAPRLFQRQKFLCRRRRSRRLRRSAAGHARGKGEFTGLPRGKRRERLQSVPSRSACVTRLRMARARSRNARSMGAVLASVRRRMRRPSAPRIRMGKASGFG